MELIYVALVALLLMGISILFFYIISRLKAKIGLTLNNHEVHPGETISGEILLNLKKSLRAKELSISLIGTYLESSQLLLNETPSFKKGKIFEFKKPLAGQGEYPKGKQKVKFEITIPRDILIKKAFSSNPLLEKSPGFMKPLSNFNKQIKWQVKAKLDLQRSDFSKGVQINIT